MNMLKLILLAALLLGMTTSASMAGKKDTFQTWAEGDKAYKKVWFGPKPGQLKHMEPGKYPRRVGLISFYLFDTGSFEYSALAATYGGTYMKKSGLNSRGANIFATEFALRSVPLMKQRFAEHDMELLTPLEFLETEEQTQTYLDFRLPESGMQKFGKAMVSFFDNNPHADGAADGYAMIPAHLWLDQEVLTVLEELRVSLGLDALAVVSNLTTSNPGTVIFGGASLGIYGPNPEPRPEEKYAKYWWPGLAYVSGTFGKGFKGIEFAYWDKEKERTDTITNPLDGSSTTYWGSSIERVEYDGYEAIIDAMTRKTLEEMDDRFGKAKAENK
jgi:hypothetical protein